MLDNIRWTVRVENRDGIGQLVIRQRQDGFIHHDGRQFRIRDGLAVRVFQRYVDVRLPARFQFAFLRRYFQRQSAFQWRDAQVETARGVSGPVRHTGERLALVIRTRCRADQVDLHVQVGDVSLLDGHFQRDTALFDGEALGVQDTVSADGQQALGRD